MVRADFDVGIHPAPGRYTWSNSTGSPSARARLRDPDDVGQPIRQDALVDLLRQHPRDQEDEQGRRQMAADRQPQRVPHPLLLHFEGEVEFGGADALRAHVEVLRLESRIRGPGLVRGGHTA